MIVFVFYVVFMFLVMFDVMFYFNYVVGVVVQVELLWLMMEVFGFLDIIIFYVGVGDWFGVLWIYVCQLLIEVEVVGFVKLINCDRNCVQIFFC